MTAYLVCPECSAHNPPDEAFCRVCQASLAEQQPVEKPSAPESEEDSFDLFDGDDKDLPDLLQGLKQDKEGLDPTEGLPEINLDRVEDQEGDNDAASEDGSQSEEGPQEDKGTPEWLETVRKRAQEEEDAVGDMIRRVSAAQENIKGERRDSRHEDFESWIQKLREEARDRAAGDQPLPDPEPHEQPEFGPEADSEPPAEADSVQEDWLTRIRKAHGMVEPDEGIDAAGRSLLDWLVALEDEQSAKDTSDSKSEGIENAATQDTQRINLKADSDQDQMTQPIPTGVSRAVQAVLNLTREEQVQADLLTAVLSDEKADRPYQPPRFRWGIQWLNVFFLLILLISLSLTLFTGGSATLFRPQAPEGAIALLEWMDTLPEDASLMLVFDYQAAYTAEMDLIARPLLETAAARTGHLTVVSSAAAGLLLSDALLEDIVGNTSAIPVEQVGYYPVESYGAYGIATGLTPSQPAANLPEPAEAILDREVDGILIFSDHFESAQAWVEQLNARASGTPLGLVVTAQAGPLLQPYVDSGQVVGMVAGLPDAAALEGRLGESGSLGHRFRAYQAGVLVLIVALLLGAVLAPPRAARNTRGDA